MFLKVPVKSSIWARLLIVTTLVKDCNIWFATSELKFIYGIDTVRISEGLGWINLQTLKPLSLSLRQVPSLEPIFTISEPTILYSSIIHST